MESVLSEDVVSEVRSQWKRMWRERIDDRVRAEGIALTDYDKLFVERGTVVLATRSFKLLTLREIFEMHKVENIDRLVQPSPEVGGWGKFVRTHITSVKLARQKRAQSFDLDEKKPQQLKKGGRGWLHI
ncbi:MAG: hypothetical protein ABSB28_01600 [Candidatus Bathyarchaeia archaeon]